MTREGALHVVAHLPDEAEISLGIRAIDLDWILHYLWAERQAEQVTVDGRILNE